MNIPERQVDRHNWETLSPLAACILASWAVDRAVEVSAVLEARLCWRRDRQMSLRTLLIGLEMLGMVGRRGHHRQIRLALRSLPIPVQRALGVVDASGRSVSYRQIEKAMCQIAAVLERPTVLVEHNHRVVDEETGEVFTCPVTCPYLVADHDWYMTAMAQASHPDDIPRALDMAIDWTDTETWAKSLFRFAPDAVTAPGDDPAEYHGDAVAPTSASRSSNAPLGPDGRAVPSKDKDARWGHRARRSGKSEFFVGSDRNTMVGAPGRDGTPFAPFIEAANLVPSGSHPGDAAVKMLRVARHFGVQARDLIADRGFTSKDPDRFCRPVGQLVDNVVLDLTETQQKRRPDYTVVLNRGKPDQRTVRILRIAGSFFSDGLPTDLHDLRRPGTTATPAERQEITKTFDRRAKFAFVRHDVLPSGSQRWAGPATVYAGFKVRCANNPRSMRAPNDRPLTTCATDEPCSCGAVVVIDDPSTERERQTLVWGTSEWKRSYDRRTVVERAYADDKFQITNFDRASVYCFGTVKHAIYYTPVIVARNIQVALRWYMQSGRTDPWGIEDIDGPDFRLPPDLGGLQSVSSPEPSSSDDAVESPTPSTTEDAAESAEDGHEDGNALAANNAVEAPRLPNFNRKQRRAEERRSRKPQPRRKPPNPPGVAQPRSMR